MPKFKKGDDLVCVWGVDDKLTRGETYKAIDDTSPFYDNEYVDVISDMGMLISVRAERFKPVDPEPSTL